MNDEPMYKIVNYKWDTRKMCIVKGSAHAHPFTPLTLLEAQTIIPKLCTHPTRVNVIEVIKTN